MAKEVLSADRRSETSLRIKEQCAIVAALEPGSQRHKLATRILLLMQDALHVLTEIDALTVEVTQQSRAAE